MSLSKSTPQEWQRGPYVISTDNSRLDVEFIHDFLSRNSYWAQGRPLEVVARSIENSFNFGLFSGNRQVGFARVVTDFATFAWLADVFVISEHRGNGCAKWIVQVITEHPGLQGFRRYLLATKDAHELYRQFGFTELKTPDRWMERSES